MLSEYQANQAKAKQLAGSLSGNQLNWKNGNGWSVAECLAHIAATNRAVGDAMKDAVDRRIAGRPATGGGLPLPGFAAHMIAKSLEPPPKFKAKAAAGTRPEGPTYDAGILDTYIASHEKLLAVLKKGGALHLSAMNFKHPVLPVRVPVDAGLAMMAAHDRRHLWQAGQVVSHPAFPKA